MKSLRLYSPIKLVFVLVLLGGSSAFSQSDFKRYYALSIGAYRQNSLINFNEQLLNDGYRQLSLIGSDVGFGMNQNLKSWRLQMDFDMATVQNKTNVAETKISLTGYRVAISLGRDVLTSNQFDLVPLLGLGFGTSELKFEMADTAKSFNSILGGYRTTAWVETKMYFSVNPRLQFAFREKEQAVNEGYFFELGYFLSPFDLMWSLPDVSLSRNSGFYFKFLYLFPQRS
jgi:hypothetical protein